MRRDEVGDLFDKVDMQRARGDGSAEHQADIDVVQLQLRQAVGPRCRQELVPFAFYLVSALTAGDRVCGTVHRNLNADPAHSERHDEVGRLTCFRLLVRAQSERRQNHIQSLALAAFLNFSRHCLPPDGPNLGPESDSTGYNVPSPSSHGAGEKPVKTLAENYWTGLDKTTLPVLQNRGLGVRVPPLLPRRWVSDPETWVTDCT